MLPKVIYIMGPPGAGKGTQAALLAEKLGYHQFSTGAAFRSVSRKNTALGRRVREIVNNGHLAPPELAAEIVIDAIRTYVARDEGLVFDGTPRTVEEAAIIDQFFKEQSSVSPLAILLQVDRDEMIRRNSKRRFCLELEQDFPVLTREDEKHCEALGGVIGRRADDDPEKLATRWDEFQDRTRPVVEQYRAEGKLKEVNGMQSIDKVQAGVMALIEAADQSGSR